MLHEGSREMSMTTKFTILIADRNPHVREFLRREMAEEGYLVRLAESGREVLRWSYCPEPLDLLILDPELPDVESAALFAQLANRIPALPMVIHSFACNEELAKEVYGEVAFVEKRGNSIDHLKTVVGEILARPNRFGSADAGKKDDSGTKH